MTKHLQTPARADEPAVTPCTDSSAPIAATGLRRVYRDRKHERVALDDVAVTIDRAERLAILGPNGSGKSTLLRILATLDRPDAGDLSILGTSIGGGSNGRSAAAALRDIRRRLGVTFQQPGLDSLLTIRENLLAQASLFGISGARASDLVAHNCRALGIADRLDSRVGTLSGGLARRADLARSLIHEPDLLLLDEPTTGLDPRARADFLDHLDQVAEARRNDRPMTIVMTTHLMDEAERCDRVAFMDAGRIVAIDTPAGLRERLGEAVLRITRGPGAPPEPILQIARTHDLKTDHANATVICHGDRPALAAAAAAIIERNLATTVEVSPPTLADAFSTITGHSLEENETGSAQQEAAA